MAIKNNSKVLIVDDDRDVLLSAQMILKTVFQSVRSLSNPSDLKEELAANPPDLVLLDMNFTRGITTGEEGLYWLQQIHKFDPNIQVVMSTAYGEIDLAVKAVKMGATDFIQKPWINEKLVATLVACCKLGESHRRIEQLQSAQQGLTSELNRITSALVGNSEAFIAVLDLIDKVADTDANVLITGENGTGKELVARAIHAKSSRSTGPLISVDIGAVPASLFESEMFGHVKGSFTDAKDSRTGKFELAAGGTLFLDEIGNLELAMQSKLLRALESQIITPVGGNRSSRTDIRLICATNRPLSELSNPELFRRDLLYRINTIEIHVPPLRERIADIPALVEHYKTLFAEKYKRPDVSIPVATIRKLQAYDWPGNIRELKHSVERAVITAAGRELGPEDFLINTRTAQDPASALNLVELEKKAIRAAIQQYGGNLTQVAKALGLGRTTLYRKMEKYELTDQ